MKYRNIKRFIRQANAQAKSESLLTGGGVVSKTLRFYIEEPAMIELGALLSLTVFGHASRFDDDAGDAETQQRPESADTADTLFGAPFIINEMETIFADENAMAGFSDLSQIDADNEVAQIDGKAVAETEEQPQAGTSKQLLGGSVVGARPTASSTPTPTVPIVKDPLLRKKWEKYSGALLKNRKNQLLSTKRRTNDNNNDDEFMGKKILTLQNITANAIRSRERDDEMHRLQMERAKYAAKREKYAMKWQKLKYRMLAKRNYNHDDNNRTLSSATSDTSDDGDDTVDHNKYPNSRNGSPSNNGDIL